MIHLFDFPVEVKQFTIPAPVVAEVPADDFGPSDDSPLWDEWAANSAAMDAVCSGPIL